MWNMGVEFLKGYWWDEIVGKYFFVFYGKEDLDSKKLEMELEICMCDGRVEDEGWCYRKDGSWFWVNVVIMVVYKNGVYVGFGKVIWDLMECKLVEFWLIVVYEESEKFKFDFLVNMSYEICIFMYGMFLVCVLFLDISFLLW